MADHTLENVPEPLRSMPEFEGNRSPHNLDQEILLRLQHSFNADTSNSRSIHIKWIYEALNSGEATPLMDAELDAAFARGVDQARKREHART